MDVKLLRVRWTWFNADALEQKMDQVTKVTDNFLRQFDLKINALYTKLIQSDPFTYTDTTTFRNKNFLFELNYEKTMYFEVDMNVVLL